MDKNGVLRKVMSMERVTHDIPVLSVIIPTWNRATMVVDTIESALAQDSPEPIEVVVLDDGSTDETPAVLRTLSKQTLPTNRSLRVIHGDHRGRTSAAQGGLTLLLLSTFRSLPRTTCGTPGGRGNSWPRNVDWEVTL